MNTKETSSTTISSTVQPSPKSVVLVNPTTDELERFKLPDCREKKQAIDDTLVTTIKSNGKNSGSTLINNNEGNTAEMESPSVLPPLTHSWTVCPASKKSIRTNNPIRAIVDPIFRSIRSGVDRGDGKDPISLALGDPTVGGNLPPNQVALDAVVNTIKNQPEHAAGYVNACGIAEARKAIAKYHSYPEHSIDADNVIIASGCSGSLEIVLSSLLDPGTAILVPQPGFPLYQVIAESNGSSAVHYRLDPDQGWECDLNHLERLMVASTTSGGPTIRALLLNNPSNPTGAVFSPSHLMEVIEFCDKHHLVLVADEVYGDLTFRTSSNSAGGEMDDKERREFCPVAQLAGRCGRRVPVITTSGLAKQFLLPGWRVGWVVFYDNKFRSLKDVEAGAKRLAQVVLGTSHLVQTVIPSLLDPDDPTQMKVWKDTLRQMLEEQAITLWESLSVCHGLEAIPPQGAMYFMIQLDLHKLDVTDDIDFSSRLLQEENVIVLPGTAFGCPNSFRVVFCAEKDTLQIASRRIQDFCLRHAK